jgi:Beta-ketoacyl synthase, N-terminal domain
VRGELLVGVRGVGLIGPGLADWATGSGLLREPASWIRSPTVIAAPSLLPPAERRRAGAVVKISLGVALEACTQAGVPPGSMATVFSSSSGDGANCHALCEALAQAERAVSPTRFTNSVHNASAGYWHIATANRQPSTSLCAFDASFTAGLLEAAVQCIETRRPVLLVVSDVPYPEPLLGARPMADSFGVALVIDAAEAPGVVARLSLRTLGGEASADTPCSDAGLDAVRRGIPAARCLPLVECIARGERAALVIGAAEGLTLAIEVMPQ